MRTRREFDGKPVGVLSGVGGAFVAVVPTSMSSTETSEAFMDSQGVGWVSPWNGGPPFTPTDAEVNMVAFFDVVPKDVKAALKFNGKVEVEPMWVAVMRHTLCARLTPWDTQSPRAS